MATIADMWQLNGLSSRRSGLESFRSAAFWGLAPRLTSSRSFDVEAPSCLAWLHLRPELYVVRPEKEVSQLIQLTSRHV